jgi:hypothetical protein
MCATTGDGGSVIDGNVQLPNLSTAIRSSTLQANEEADSLLLSTGRE